MPLKTLIRLVIGLVWAPLCAAQTYDALQYESTTNDVLHYKRRSDFFSSSDAFFVDGTIKALPTEAVTFDRTLFSQVRVGGNYLWTPSLSIRPVLTGLNAYRKEEGKQEPRKISSEMRSELKPELMMTYTTASGPELVFGMNFWIFSAFDRNSETDKIRTVESVAAANLHTPFLAIVKRGGNFEGGFSYKIGAEKSRAIKIVNSQDESELSFNDAVHDPTTAGLFFRLKAGGSEVGANFDAIEAGAGGSRTDNGDTVHEDYMRFRAEAKTSLASAVTLGVALTHRTLSYADNRNVTFPSMPMTAIHVRAALGSEDTYTFVGIMYGTGKDGQSLPEFNAEYKISAVGGSLGINLSF